MPPYLFDPDTLEPLEADKQTTDVASLLFGSDRTERVVAAEVAGNKLILWRRLPDDTIERLERPAEPWILLTDPDDAPTGSRLRELEGDDFRWLAVLPSWDSYRAARMELQGRHAEHIAYASPTRAALTTTGITLFKGMSMADVRRMQIDIETAGLDPQKPDDRILLIAVGDNRGLSTSLEGSEPDILRQLLALVQERDPDVIEGHNIHGFDMPFLAARYQLHGMRPTLGRDNREAYAGYRRTFAIGGISRPVVPWHIPGRHVVDTFLAVQRFDWARGVLRSYGLKEVARALGISAEDRVELPRDRMAELYRTDRSRVVTYALQDIAETARLAELVTPTEFYQTQMVPDSYASSALSGTGEKINALFIRAYLHAGRSIPRPRPPRSYEGGYTAVARTGVIRRIVKADFESLYPSIMLAYGIRPETDWLGVFLPVLKELTRRRLEAKAEARRTTGSESQYWDGLQSSFKVLINSFYGYLGAGGFNFNDPEAAARVTSIGRDLVKQVAERVEEAGGSVIEVDTDGIYFVPPADITSEEDERAFVEELGRGLPEGIRLVFDGRYETMVSVKTKNYVLRDYDGKLTFKGASLRSRADEPYGTRFLAEAVDLLMRGEKERLRDLYLRVVRDLQEHRYPIDQLARRERISDKVFSSSSRQRLSGLAEGLTIGDYITVYERLNGELGRVEDYQPGDENVAYYIDKLYKFASRLRDAIGDDFDRLFPRPRNGQITLEASLDLFGQE